VGREKNDEHPVPWVEGDKKRITEKNRIILAPGPKKRGGGKEYWKIMKLGNPFSKNVCWLERFRTEEKGV